MFIPLDASLLLYNLLASILCHVIVSLPVPYSKADSKHKTGPTSDRHHLETLSWAVQLHVPGSSYRLEELHHIAEQIAKEVGLQNEGQITALRGYYLFTHEVHHHITKQLQEQVSWSQLHNLHSLNNQTRDHGTNDNNYNTTENVTNVGHVFPDHPTDCSRSAQAGLRHLVSKSHNTWLETVAEVHKALDSHPNIVSYSQQLIRLRKKRSVLFNDPAFPQQWHLLNHKNPRYDINVTDVWANNITGQGVTAAVVDDGLEWRNMDLRDNYSPEGSWDLNSNDPDPSPHGEKNENHHGTRCGGEIAATANNAQCGVGVAYGAKIAGIRVLDGPMTDSLEATAFLKKYEVNDVYSCSWGPDDDGKTVDGPHYLANTALRHGVEYGRQGYGAIYVVASGNGGRFGDNCNFDGYANSVYTITIGAVDEMGEMPYYAEECASMLAVTFSSGGGTSRNIVTTDWTADRGSGCTDSHTGTSAAAPIAAGLVALILQARPCLSWRDVQHIIIMAAVKVDVDLAHWSTNKAGFHHSHKHGFGLMDAWRMVNAAKVWLPVPWMTVFTSELLKENKAIPMFPKELTVEHQVPADVLSGYSLATLEYVQVTVTITHRRRGDVMLWLRCPTNTKSVLAAPRAKDDSKEGFVDWTFSTVRCWGEEPQGTWKVIITDKGKPKESGGVLVRWTLKLFGSPMTFKQVDERRKLVAKAARGKYLHDNQTRPCPPPDVKTKFVAPLAEKTLKLLVLIGAGCAFLAIYEMMEYTFCYKEEKEECLKEMKRAQRQRASGQSTSDGVSGDTSETTRLLDAEEIPMDTLTTNQEESYSLQSAPLLDSARDSAAVDENVIFDRTNVISVDVNIETIGNSDSSNTTSFGDAAGPHSNLIPNNSQVALHNDSHNTHSDIGSNVASSSTTHTTYDTDSSSTDPGTSGKLCNLQTSRNSRLSRTNGVPLKSSSDRTKLPSCSDSRHR